MHITMRNKTVDDHIKSKRKIWIYQISKIMPDMTPRAWDLVSDKTILVTRTWPMGEKTQQSL